MDSPIRHHYNEYLTQCKPDGSPCKLGQGRFGITVRATRHSRLGDEEIIDEFAIKILHPEIADSQKVVKRFVSEIHALRKLSHGNLIRYHGADTAETGEIFLIMELCQGGSLTDFVKQHGRLNETAVAKVALQIVRGLRETHAKGFLHQDLKPSNVLISEVCPNKNQFEKSLGEDPNLLKVADFGLADQLTNGRIFGRKFRGTALFASPEQFQHRNLDVRTDLYSLGMLMWYLLKGRSPYNISDYDSVSDLHTSDVAHVETEEMKSLGLSRGFTEILGRLLAKKKRERYPNAKAAENALLRYIETHGSAPLVNQSLSLGEFLAAREGEQLKTESIFKILMDVGLQVDETDCFVVSDYLLQPNTIYFELRQPSDFFSSGRWKKIPIYQWPSWQIFIAGAEALSTEVTLTDDMLTHSPQAETFVEDFTRSVEDEEEPEPPNIFRDDLLKGNDVEIIKRFARLAYRLFAGKDAGEEFEPVDRLGFSSNRLLRLNLGELVGTHSAAEMVGALAEFEEVDIESIHRAHFTDDSWSHDSREFDSTVMLTHLNESAESATEAHHASEFAGTEILTDPSSEVLETAEVEDSDESPARFALSRNWLLAGFFTLGFGALVVLNLLLLDRPVGEKGGDEVLLLSEGQQPIQPVNTVLSSRPDSNPAAPGSAEALLSNPRLKPEQLLQAARDYQFAEAERFKLLEKAAAGFDEENEPDLARLIYLELAGLAGSQGKTAQARFLVKADRLGPLGIRQWTFIYQNTDSDQLKKEYQKRAINYLALTDPEEAWKRLNIFAENSEDDSEKLDYWGQAINLPGLKDEWILEALRKMAETGGASEKLNLYDFYRARTAYREPALEMGRQLYQDDSKLPMLARKKIAIQLWESHRAVDALKWLADHAKANDVSDQKFRWRYYQETQATQHADAAKFLAQSDELPGKERANYGWLYFRSLSLKERGLPANRSFLDQAVSAGINDAVVYSEHARQIVESRRVAERAEVAAAEALATAARLDREMKEVLKQSIRNGEKLDEEAYEKKMSELGRMLRKTRNADGNGAVAREGRIFWNRFLTWEEAVGLRAQAPYTEKPTFIVISDAAFADLKRAVELGHPQATARLASIFAGINPLQPPSEDYEKAAILAARIYQQGGAGSTEATLVLRYMLSGEDPQMRSETMRVLNSMNINQSNI